MLLGCALLLPLLPLVMVASAANRERAILEIVLYERNAHGEYETKVQYELRGLFSPAGAKTSAEGQILQVHPLALCNDGVDDSLLEYGWVGVVKLEKPEVNPRPCLSLYEKTQHAIQRGATAIIFDVTDNEYAIGELRQGHHPALDRPVITVKGREAKKLRRIIDEEKVARARIKSVSQLEEDSPKSGTADYFDMGIFLAFFILLCIIGVVVILKLRWRSRTQRLSMTDIAKRVVTKMETRKFRSPYDWPLRHSSSLMSGLYSLDSNAETCAICLEQYKDGQELRVVPCRHEFHRHCVDKWLIANRTCPLCLFNIIECPVDSEGSLCSSPDPTNQQPEPPSVRLHVPSTSSSNYNNLPAPVPIPNEVEHPNYAYKFPVQAYAGFLYNEMAPSNVHNLNQYSQTRHISNVRDYYQMPSVSTAGPSNFRQVEFRAAHPGLHYVTTTTVGHSNTVLSPHSKSNIHRKMAHVHSPRSRMQAKCIAADNGVTCTSSDSENEFTWLSHARQNAPHLHDSRSQCDADVSGTSTEPDIDDNLLKSSDGSNVDVSNNSTFGSSHVVSDVSSFDSKVYMSYDAIGGAMVQGSKNNAVEHSANIVSAHSLAQSAVAPKVVGDSDASLVSIDTSAISPIDISDSWSDKTCDIVNFDPHSGCPVCRTRQRCDASSNAVTMTSVTSITCDVSADLCRGHLRTSGVGQNQRRSLVYWHDKTNALNRARCCYSLASRESPWQRSHIGGHQMAWQQHGAATGHQRSELYRAAADDCPFVDCVSEGRVAFDRAQHRNSRDFAVDVINAASCAAAETRNRREDCAMTDDHLVESYCDTKDKTDLLTRSRSHTRDQNGPVSDQYRLLRDHRFILRNHNISTRYNTEPPTDRTGLLMDHCGPPGDHCGNRDNNGPSMDSDVQKDHCDLNSGPWRDRSGLTREHRATPKNHSDHSGRTRFHRDNSGLTKDHSGLVKDHSDPVKDHKGLHKTHSVAEGRYRDIAKAKCAKGKYYVGTKRDHQGSRCRGHAVNNPRIAQLTTADCKETMVCQRSHGPVVTMSLGADATYHPSNVV